MYDPMGISRPGVVSGREHLVIEGMIVIGAGLRRFVVSQGEGDSLLTRRAASMRLVGVMRLTAPRTTPVP